jgi:hypothetical protein
MALENIPPSEPANPSAAEHDLSSCIILAIDHQSAAFCRCTRSLGLFWLGNAHEAPWLSAHLAIGHL